MSTFPHNLYTPQQVRELDRIAVEQFELSGTVLLERAGTAAFALLQQRYPDARKISVMCGTGNNGGDGYVIARLAHEHKLDVSVYQVGDSSRVQGDALAAKQRLEGAGISVQQFDVQVRLDDSDLIIDALLGTGFSGEVEGDFARAIGAMNNSPAQVLAIDVPSGLNADTGHATGEAIRADSTITFIGQKRGLLTGDALDCCGELLFDDLRVPQELYEQQQSVARVLDYQQLKQHLHKRSRNSHKGDFGHVLIVGGDAGMSGAVRLAGEAALRTGAGLVSIVTRRSHAPMLTATRPELMCHGVENSSNLAPLLKRASVVVIGPGLGNSDWAEDLVSGVMRSELPMVVDADALAIVAREHFKRDHWVLTPHPGEAGRMLGISSQDIQAERFGKVAEISERFGGTVVLKGAGTLVHSKDGSTGVCPHGNPGMASGGMGDLLSGVIASFIGQGMEPAIAARLAVCVQGMAADMAVSSIGERGLLASDLMANLRRLVNP